MQITRHKTKVIKIGNVYIGARHPIAVQSMIKAKTKDIEATLRQIKELERVGCEIVRLAVRDSLDARAIKKIKAKTKMPLVADIHFNWRLATEAIDNGADKIRLNPGNIYKKEEIRQVVAAAKQVHIPIRVGVNSGSVTARHQSPVALPAGEAGSRKSQADKMVKSALDYIKILEGFGFHDIVISLKASNVFDTIEAYRKIAGLCDYPLHLGVTATGLPLQGAIKSTIAVGVLLLEGIGDTIRISLTDEPREEVKVAKAILEATALRFFGPEIISCPTCGRCEVDLIKIVKELEQKLSTRHSLLATRPLKLAVMGCVVNGPGEAAQADIGVAFGKRQGLLFKQGKPVRKISYANCVNILLKESK